jgi:hypothetical protein
MVDRIPAGGAYVVPERSSSPRISRAWAGWPPGARVGPVCRTDDDAVLAGCRLVLKGGQVGPVDMFRRFAGGS